MWHFLAGIPFGFCGPTAIFSIPWPLELPSCRFFTFYPLVCLYMCRNTPICRHMCTHLLWGQCFMQWTKANVIRVLTVKVPQDYLSYLLYLKPSFQWLKEKWSQALHNSWHFKIPHQNLHSPKWVRWLVLCLSAPDLLRGLYRNMKQQKKVHFRFEHHYGNMHFMNAMLFSKYILSENQLIWFYELLVNWIVHT